MTKIIRRVKELPNWFDINKYEPVKHFNAHNWAFNILIREIAFNGDKIRTERHDEISKKRAKDILENGAITKFSVNYDKDIERFMLTSLQLGTASLISKILGDDKAFKKQQEDSFGQGFIPGWVDESYNEKYCSDSNLKFLQVNLVAPDEKLVELFKQWLLVQRENNKMRDQKYFFSEIDFSSWHKYGVLPYMDLSYWSEMNDVKIPFHVMGEAIIDPDIDVDVSEAVRKTTKKYVDLLKNDDTYETLYCQACLEYGKK